MVRKDDARLDGLQLMKCVIVDTGEKLDCQVCGRMWDKSPRSAPEDCFPMLANNLRIANGLLVEVLEHKAAYGIPEAGTRLYHRIAEHLGSPSNGDAGTP